MKKKVRKVKKNVKIAMIALVCMALPVCAGLFTLNAFSSSSQFEVSDSAQFYVVGADRITGYAMDNDAPSVCADSKVKVLRKNVNFSIERADLENRYLLFTDDAWPKGNSEGIVSVDFEKGNVRFLKTKHNAYTAAGATDNYYFAVSASSEDSPVWVYSPDLKEVSAATLDQRVILSNFKADSSPFLFTGTAVDLSEDASGAQFFKNYLYS